MKQIKISVVNINYSQLRRTMKCPGCDGPRRSVAGRSYPSLKVRVETKSARLRQHRSGGLEELPHVRCNGRRRRGTTPPWRSGAPPERSYLTSKEPLLCGRRRAQRSYSTFKVRRGGREKKPLTQGKEQS